MLGYELISLIKNLKIFISFTEEVFDVWTWIIVTLFYLFFRDGNVVINNCKCRRICSEKEKFWDLILVCKVKQTDWPTRIASEFIDTFNSVDIKHLSFFNWLSYARVKVELIKKLNPVYLCIDAAVKLWLVLLDVWENFFSFGFSVSLNNSMTHFVFLHDRRLKKYFRVLDLQGELFYYLEYLILNSKAAIKGLRNSLAFMRSFWRMWRIARENLNKIFDPLRKNMSHILKSI